MTRLLYLLLPILLIISLNACSTMSYKRAYCNMLKSRLIFNGSTTYSRNADIENSTTPLEERTYYQGDCSKHDPLN